MFLCCTLHEASDQASTPSDPVTDFTIAFGSEPMPLASILMHRPFLGGVSEPGFPIRRLCPVPEMVPGDGGGADGAITHVCLVIRVHGCNKLKWSGANAPDSSAGLPAGQNPYAYSLRRQVPGVPGANLNQPQGEEKGAEVRPPHPQLLRRQEAATFSIALTLEAPGPDHHDQYPEHQPLDVIS